MLKFIATVCLTLFSSQVFAQSDSQKFLDCLSTNASESDKKLVSRIILIGLAKDPELEKYVSLNDGVIENTRRDLAEAADRLLIFGCSNSARRAMRVDGIVNLQATIGNYLQASAVAQIQEFSKRITKLGLLDDVDRDGISSALGMPENK